MKRTIKSLALAMAMAVFAVPVLAQSTECNDENKGTWYKTFYDNFRGTAEQQKTAYDAAQTYLKACPADPADKQAEYMKKFVGKYDEMINKSQVGKQFDEAVKSKNYPEQIRLGKQILSTDPDNPAVNIIMGLAGLDNEALLPDSAQAATKAIALIEAGKPFAPVASKEQALAYLNWVVAKSKVKSDPNAAIAQYIKVARFEADPKKSPRLYNELAAAYGEGPVAKLAEDYKKFIGQPESTESKLVKANLNQAIERQIDAFARAAALSTNPADKKAIMDVLTDLYKSTHTEGDAAAGLNELVAKVLSTPVPDVPTPITTLPAQSSTGANTGTSTNGATNGTATAPPGAKKPKS